jgi:hypothetical protein
MSGVGTHEGLTHRKRPRGREDLDAAAVADVELEQLLCDLYADWKGHAPYTWRQRRNLTAAAWWLVGVLAHEDGQTFRRSWPQVIRAIGHRVGWDTSGDVEEIKQRYGAPIKVLLGYLVGMGLLDGWEAVPDSRPGEYAGMRFEISAAARSLLSAQIASASVAKLHRRAPRRRGEGCEPARKLREIDTPSGEHGRFSQSLDPLKRSVTGEAVPARHAFREGAETGQQHTAVDANERSGTATDGAALERLRTAASGERAAGRAAGGLCGELDAIVAALERASAAGAPSGPIAIIGFEQMRLTTGHSPNVRIHPKRYRPGFAGLDVADRYGAFGEGCRPGSGRPAPGISLLLAWMRSSALCDWEPLEITSRHLDREAELNRRAAGTVASLSHFLCQIGQLGREWRRHARERGGYNRQRKGRRRGTNRAHRRRGGAC